MKTRKPVELFFARLQTVRGRFKCKIFGIEGAINLGKPLEPHEVRETLGNGYLDLHSYDLEAIHDYVDKIRENQNPAKKAISERPKPRRALILEASRRVLGLS